MIHDPAFVHPETLPGEPVRRWSALGTLGVLVRRLALVLLSVVAGAPFWALYLLMRLVWPRPPVVFSWGRAARVARLILAERPPGGPTAAMRLGLLLELARREALNGLRGCSWFLDQILYGRALEAVKIVEPVFEISAARSGSTQIARYLEDDPHLVAPRSGDEAFPFLWLWRLFKRLKPMLPDGIEERLARSKLPPEHYERHEVDPHRTDTFEIIYLVMFQLGDIIHSLGPRALAEDFRFDQIQPACREVWERDFMAFIDGVGRRTLLDGGLDPEGQPRRLLIKGHFLLVAPLLAERYPDARFLTVLRAPEKRLQSIINFFHCQATIEPCPAVPFPWLAEYAATVEVAYCETERAWFGAEQGPRRCVIPFDRYLMDLEGTMREVYRVLLDRELSPHVPRQHAERVRTNYSVDRSLAQLGIDEAALKQTLAAYGRWCRGGPAA